MEQKKTIYDLDLHEGIRLYFGIYVLRVASGWIYDCWDFDTDSFKQGIFVPFDNAFQQNIDEEENDNSESQEDKYDT